MDLLGPTSILVQVFIPETATPAERVYQLLGGKPVQVCWDQAVYNGSRRQFPRDLAILPPGRTQDRCSSSLLLLAFEFPSNQTPHVKVSALRFRQTRRSAQDKEPVRLSVHVLHLVSL